MFGPRPIESYHESNLLYRTSAALFLAPFGLAVKAAAGSTKLTTLSKVEGPVEEPAHPTLEVGINIDPLRGLGVGQRLISLRLKRVAAFTTILRRLPRPPDPALR